MRISTHGGVLAYSPLTCRRQFHPWNPYENNSNLRKQELHLLAEMQKFTAIVENNFTSCKPPAALCLTHTNVLPLLFLTHTSVLFIQMGMKPPISTVGWRISRLNQTPLKSRASDLTLRRRICSVGACFPSILSADRYIQSGLLLAVCCRDACIYLGSFSERHP